MRAQLVNEELGFERNKSARKAMDLGGINLLEKRKELESKYLNDWTILLDSVFNGHTITAEMAEFPGSGKPKIHTIKVFKYDYRSLYNDVIIRISENKQHHFILELNQKIFIEE